MTAARAINPYGLRLPPELKQWVENRAKQNNRSINAEIVTIFQELRAREEQTAELKPVS